jgi:hypothetical protein
MMESSLVGVDGLLLEGEGLVKKRNLLFVEL